MPRRRSTPPRLSALAQLTLEELRTPLDRGFPVGALIDSTGLTYSEIRRRLERLERELNAADRPCGWCGALLPPGSRSHRLYCSGRCKVAAFREVKRASTRRTAASVTRRKISVDSD